MKIDLELIGRDLARLIEQMLDNLRKSEKVKITTYSNKELKMNNKVEIRTKQKEVVITNKKHKKTEEFLNRNKKISDFFEKMN